MQTDTREEVTDSDDMSVSSQSDADSDDDYKPESVSKEMRLSCSSPQQDQSKGLDDAWSDGSDYGGGKRDQTKVRTFLNKTSS